MNRPERAAMTLNVAHLSEQMLHLWNHLLDLPHGHATAQMFPPHAFRPPADVFQTPDAVIVVMEIAGMRDESIDVRLEGRRLLVRGVRRDPFGAMPRAYSAVEIPYGPFERVIVLPADVDAERAEARYDDGLLRLILPKRPPQPSISVHIAIG
jgi:HSP20 family protein